MGLCKNSGKLSKEILQQFYINLKYELYKCYVNSYHMILFDLKKQYAQFQKLNICDHVKSKIINIIHSFALGTAYQVSH